MMSSPQAWGDPITDALKLYGGMSSPQAWGWSAEESGLVRDGEVVPTSVRVRSELDPVPVAGGLGVLTRVGLARRP